ncbi:MAG: 6-phosphogluconolactonase [Deltaproteobacteria bacterium]|nr:6-phosphogluconolactonase [Deltaproteobacteria bacterium]
MDIRVFKNPDDLAKGAAKLFFERLLSSSGKCFSVALAGGNTPLKLYQEISKTASSVEDNLPFTQWEKVHFFFGDERCVSPSSSESNYKFARDELTSKIRITENQVHRIKGELGAVDGAKEYTRELSGFFAPKKVSFDIVFLGLGTDGHTLSVFPGFDSNNYDESELVVSTTSKSHKYDRITLTPEVVNNSNLTIFLVSGESKATALKEALEGDLKTKDFPAKLIHPKNNNLIWMVDKEAASLLSL